MIGAWNPDVKNDLSQWVITCWLFSFDKVSGFGIDLRSKRESEKIRHVEMKHIILHIAASLMSLCLSNLASGAEYWKWSPSAAHHSAAVHVWSTAPDGNRYGGSGVYVTHNGMRGVLTAAHILKSNSITVTFSDGTKVSTGGTIDGSKDSPDVAWIYVVHPTIQPIAVSAERAKNSDRVEFMGFGGSTGRLRHFYGTMSDRIIGGTSIIRDTHVLSGDSGSGVLNDSHELIGIQSTGGRDNIPAGHITDNNGVRWPIWVYGAAVQHKHIVSFLGRVQTKGVPNTQKFLRGFT